ncbi:MAG: hypothetical protein J6L03_07225 [Bacteroidaceae bacterium]|nr:hypothetical protein [Bacteroidaceae bacterium]
MKKKIFLTLVVVAMTIGGASAAFLYTAWCGVQTITVDPSFFDSPEEALDFYRELDEILCG